MLCTIEPEIKKQKPKNQPQLPKPLKYVPGAIPGKHLNQKRFSSEKKKKIRGASSRKKI
jgi:hypothetical protein